MFEVQQLPSASGGALLSFITADPQQQLVSVELQGSGWYEQKVFYATERDFNSRKTATPYGKAQMTQLRYGKATVRIPKLREPGQDMAYRIPFAMRHTPSVKRNGRYNITLFDHHAAKPMLDDYDGEKTDAELGRVKVDFAVPDVFRCAWAACCGSPEQEGRCREPLEHTSARAVFLQQVKEAVNASARRELVVFVHGYNVNHEACMKSAAQLTFDSAQDYSTIDIPGHFHFKTDQRAVVAFDWASNASLLSYGFVPCVQDDRERAAEAGPKLAHLLLDLATKLKEIEAEGAPCKGLHIVAHSMGNYVLHYAIQHLANQPDCPGRIDALAAAAAASAEIAPVEEHLPTVAEELPAATSASADAFAEGTCDTAAASAAAAAAHCDSEAQTKAADVAAVTAAADDSAHTKTSDDLLLQQQGSLGPFMHHQHKDWKQHHEQQQRQQQSSHTSSELCLSSPGTSSQLHADANSTPQSSMDHTVLTPTGKSGDTPFLHGAFNRDLMTFVSRYSSDGAAAAGGSKQQQPWSFKMADTEPERDTNPFTLRNFDSSKIILMHTDSLMRTVSAGHLLGMTKTIILAAADVSRHDLIKTVRQIKVGAAMHKVHMPHITLYCSRRDQALCVSSFLRVLGLKRTDGRAGFFLRKFRLFEGHIFHPFLFNDVTSIDCTGFSADWLGHSYFREHRQVLTDISQLFEGHTKVKHRTAIKSAKDGEPWRCQRCNEMVVGNETIELYTVMTVQEQHDQQLQLVRKQLLRLMQCTDLHEWQTPPPADRNCCHTKAGL